MIGHDSASGQLRTFKVERIEHAEQTAETFDIPPDFDAARPGVYNHGLYHRPSPQKRTPLARGSGVFLGGE